MEPPALSFLVSLATRQECRGSLNECDGFEVEDWGSRLIGFLQIESKAKRPIIEVVGVDESLMDGEAVFGNMGVAGVAGFGVEADLVAGGVVGVELLEEVP